MDLEIRNGGLAFLPCDVRNIFKIWLLINQWCDIMHSTQARSQPQNSKGAPATSKGAHNLHHKKVVTKSPSQHITARGSGLKFSLCRYIFIKSSFSWFRTLLLELLHKSRYCHITPVLASLHWLPVHQKIDNCFQGTAPPAAFVPCYKFFQDLYLQAYLHRPVASLKPARGHRPRSRGHIIYTPKKLLPNLHPSP